ncbi:hypothetical protein TIFTF001_014302 [Ficus carica]|uniref:Uncharacterized protein n=1 Tax=Ficus carica TaxID=3494 RepID=A0AA88A521_FICCA|nr:hypothetical protein TIFTF001_014302 [Ficus carica]
MRKPDHRSTAAQIGIQQLRERLQDRWLVADGLHQKFELDGGVRSRE